MNNETETREFAIDAVIEDLSERERSEGLTIIRDAEQSNRAVILSYGAVYVIQSDARTRTATVSATSTEGHATEAVRMNLDY